MISLADDQELMEAFAVHPETFDPAIPHTMVYAPCCGRRTPADTIAFLGGLSTEIRAGGLFPKADLDWACDGCLHILVNDESNGWTWSNLYAALGASPERIRFHVAREVELDAQRNAAVSDEALAKQGLPRQGVNPQEIFEVAFENLPADLTNDPATQRPDVTASK